jgi:hypothetical protein
MTWRNVSIVLAIACCWLLWRDCRRGRPKCPDPEPEQCERVLARARGGHASWSTRDRADAERVEPAQTGRGGLSFQGFQVPAWALRLTPQPGENLLDYRDRIVPLAQAAVAPHRARVARGRDDFAAIANLDSRQRAELDAAVEDAATQIQDRVLDAVLGGDLSPSSFKPMTGVSVARDVLDAVDRANQRFLATLREDQRAQLASHPFDLADYLVFATRWEAALGM